MIDDNLYQRLIDAGYAEEEARQIVASSPAARQQAEADQQRQQRAQSAGPPHPILDQLLALLTEYLAQLLAQRNVTPGQHPATEQLLDELHALRSQAQEDGDDGPDQSA